MPGTKELGKKDARNEKNSYSGNRFRLPKKNQSEMIANQVGGQTKPRYQSDKIEALNL